MFAELAATDPGGVRYRTFRLEDGVTFIHVAETDGENPLGDLASFQEFQRELLDRCDEPPAPMGAEMIGSYRLRD